MLRTVLLTALLAGALSGVLLTVVQQWQVIPLIELAELGEPALDGLENALHEHGAHGGHDHVHEEKAWEPQAGFERTLLTLVSNVLAGVGFSFLLVAAMLLARADGWRRGLLWGAAAFGVFFVAPALGLPPKLPGTAAAALQYQQIWWLATVAATAVGLSLLVFSGNYALKVVGVLFVLTPQLVGAPVAPEAVVVSEPMLKMSRQFIIATSLANGVYWLVMGAACGYLLRRLLAVKVTDNKLSGIGEH